MAVPSTNPFPTQNGSYLGVGANMGGTSISPGGLSAMPTGMPNGFGNLGASPFQTQMQAPQQTGFASSPPPLPSGVGNPFSQMLPQPQQTQQQFLSNPFPTSIGTSSSPFNNSPSPFGFAGQGQQQPSPFMPQQTPSFVSQPAPNPFSQMTGANNSMQMNQAVPQMGFNPSPSPFGGMNQMTGVTNPSPFQQPQQQQSMFGGPQGQANGAAGQNPFTSWVKSPPSTQGYPGQSQSSPWG